MLCCVILCSPMYSANESSIGGYNNNMICALWRTIEASLQLMAYERLISTDVVSTLLNTRSSSGFSSFICGNDESLHRTVTSASLLSARDRLIQSSRRALPYDDSNYTVLRYSKCMIYRSLSACLASVMHIRPILTYRPKRVRCDHKAYTCMVLHDASIRDVCIECGIDGPCSVTVDIQGKYISFGYEQSTCPSRFLDSCNELPDVVRSHLSSFMDRNGATNNVCNGIALDATVPVISCREHIMWSSIMCPGRTYVISMTRPTLNFSSYRVSVRLSPYTHLGAAVSSVSDIAHRVRKFKPSEIRIDSDAMSPHSVIMSGVMAHWYAKRMPVESNMISCSLGSSVMQLHRASNGERAPSVDRLALNAHVLSTMVRNTNGAHRCIVTAHRNKVTIAFPTAGGIGSGPVLTLGCNGGFRWIGRVSELGSNLTILAMLIQSNSVTPTLASVLSLLQADDNPIYPSGISRARRS